MTSISLKKALGFCLKGNKEAIAFLDDLTECVKQSYPHRITFTPPSLMNLAPTVELGTSLR
jgi:hypothetical protein